MKRIPPLRHILPFLALAASLQITLGYYDPSIQRWINRDPISEQGGINLCAFVANDPVSRVDFHGEIAFPTFTIPIYFDCPGQAGGCYKCIGEFSTNLPLPRNSPAFQVCLGIMIVRMVAACAAGNYNAFVTSCDKAYACFLAFWGK